MVKGYTLSLYGRNDLAAADKAVQTNSSFCQINIGVVHHSKEYFTYDGSKYYGEMQVSSAWRKFTTIHGLFRELPTHGQRGNQFKLDLKSQ